MTDYPVGDPVRAFRTALARARRAEQRARAHRAEAEVRRLRQLLAQEDQQQ